MKKILLIDDDDNIRDIFHKILVYSGYQVSDASNGEEGIELLKKYDGDNLVVITDIGMPEKDGNEVAGYARNVSKNKGNKAVIGIVASDDVDTKLLDHIFLKPYKSQDVIKIINYL